MCGICGIAYPNRPVEPAALQRMRESLSHRGPDGAGQELFGNVGFGHRRLSIIDLAGGAQPMANEDGNVWVTYNGEIYNFADVRRDLETRGHRFRTRSDSEVLVHGHEEYGADLPRRLNGIFAYALYDRRDGSVTIARDHLGVKPMFYAAGRDGALVFGSEIKAVLAALDDTPEIDADAVDEYLTFRYVTGTRTMYRGVMRLPPGTQLRWRAGRMDVQPYWRVTDAALRPPADDAADLRAIGELTDAAVAAQLMSDVPLGTFCSGGVDSGLVTALAARHHRGALHTFSVGFDDPRWDETALARDTATRHGTEHHVLRADPERFFGLLDKLIGFHDEPLSHPNSIPLYLLSCFAREHVTVVLTGEGADELFCGYPRYQLARAAGAPAAARRLLAAAAGALPGRRAGLAARLLPLSFEDALVYNSAYVAPDVVSRLSGRDPAGAVAQRRELARHSRTTDAVSSLSRYELQTYLVCALDRMDRMSMATGLEGRVPFLDMPLVEWALGLPARAKLRGRATKYVVKQLAAQHLSPRVVRGPKSGFGLPLPQWFRGGTLAPVLDRLDTSAHPATTLVDPTEVRRLLRAHRAGTADHSEALWLLLNLYVWREIAVAAPATQPA
jgi:asparagine synthase (glutamine-hydrolysing)